MLYIIVIFLILGCIIQVLNLYANDGERLYDGATWAPHIAAGPVAIIAGTACAITLVGVWTLIGLVIMLLILLLQVNHA